MRKIHTLTGVSLHRIRVIKEDNLNQLKNLANSLSDSLKDKLLVNADYLFDSAVKVEKVDKASTLQLATAGGIMLDKSRLLSDKSTSNISLHSEVIGINEKIQALKDFIDTNRTEPVETKVEENETT